MKLIFATNNPHKVEEIKAALHGELKVVGLKEAGIDIEIPEPHDTLEANATTKSRTIYTLTNTNCFSEDTGLEVEALSGAPGVLSARYAGDTATYSENVQKLLHEMNGKPNRKARFRTIISLIEKEAELQFEGICEGIITTQTKGSNGFGYDPVFIPNGSNKTFAEMTMEEKKEFSHRAKAVRKLVLYLNNQSVK